MTIDQPDLTQLLDKAAAASNADRIDYRDAIAAHGTEAIAAMTGWVEADRHPYFAIAVMEAIGRLGHGRALTELRQVADRRPALASAVTAAIERLNPQAGVEERRTTPRRSGVLDEVSGDPPGDHGPCQFLTKSGQPCQNLGRYWREGRWSCSRVHAL